MSTAQPPASTLELPDRSSWLIVFGSFQILLGCLGGLMALMMIFMALIGPMLPPPKGQAIDAQAMIPAAVLYSALAVAFVWLGVGSVRARRWAWTLTVVVSWMWLIIGLASSVFIVAFAGPIMSAAMQQQGNQMPPEMLLIMQITMGSCLGCIYILLPGLFLLFYHQESMRATCQRWDPKIPWTDRCPMPVLALSILCAFSALSMTPTLARGVLPVFGVILSGAAGAAVILALMLVMAYLAWGMYRLQAVAWWVALLLGIVGILNMAAFSRIDMMDMLEKMKTPAAQLEMMKKSGMIEAMQRWIPGTAAVSGIAWLGYLWYVRRYFVRSDEETVVDPRTF